MNGYDFKFLIVTLGASFVRVATSENHSWRRSILTVGMAVFAAYTFTDAVLHYFNFPPSYNYAVAALLALTGEGFMRFVITVANDPGKHFFDLLAKWRGK